MNSIVFTNGYVQIKFVLNADKTKCMVFSYGPNALNSAIKIG